MFIKIFRKKDNGIRLSKRWKQREGKMGEIRAGN